MTKLDMDIIGTNINTQTEVCGYRKINTSNITQPVFPI